VALLKVKKTWEYKPSKELKGGAHEPTRMNLQLAVIKKAHFLRL
jgi:hypothetical protein